MVSAAWYWVGFDGQEGKLKMISGHRNQESGVGNLESGLADSGQVGK